MPSIGGLLQGIVVISLPEVDLFLKGDVFPDIKSIPVQKQEGKQT